VSYHWPTQAGGRGEVIEEYNYLNLESSTCDSTDADFDAESNKAYNFYS